jgi:hypothetical protein
MGEIVQPASGVMLKYFPLKDEKYASGVFCLNIFHHCSQPAMCSL